jgi:hypothetical protein
MGSATLYRKQRTCCVYVVSASYIGERKKSRGTPSIYCIVEQDICSVVANGQVIRRVVNAARLRKCFRRKAVAASSELC